MIFFRINDGRASLHRRRAFTLIELLVVIGLMAGLMAFVIGGFGGGKSASLQSAQAMVANLVVAARTRAMASGQSVRLLLQVDPDSASEPIRYLRYLAIQEQIGGGWQPVADAYLPEGVFVLPGNFTVIPAGLLPAEAASTWVRSDGAALRSTVFQNGNITNETINSAGAEKWVNFLVSATGTTAQTGSLVLALGVPRPAGSYAAGESPVVLENPETVRGLKLSQYGVCTLINDRTGF